MAITQEDVKKIAKLAKLRLSPEEITLYQSQLGKILESMEELSKLDVSQVPPTASVLGLSNILRDDVPEPFEGAEKLLSNAPAREGTFYKVKKVLE